MRRAVVDSQVGLYFDNPARGFAVRENFAEQGARDFHRRALVEGSGKRLRSSYSSSLPLNIICFRLNFCRRLVVPILQSNSTSLSSIVIGFVLGNANTRSTISSPVKRKSEDLI